MMTALVNAAAFQLVALLTFVITVVFVIGRVEQVVPRESRLEAWVQRWAATAQALVIVAGLLAAGEVIYGADHTTWRWLTLGVFAVIGWSSRRALSDWASGITLRAEGTLRAGVRIGVGTERGRVRRLGLRSAEVEAENGRVLRLPYTGLAEANIEVGSDEDSGRSHTFTVDIDGTVDVGELSDRVVAGALLSPWSAAVPSPQVRVLDRGRDGLCLEVTVYPVDPAFVMKVEEAVRAVVAGASRPMSGS